MKARIKKTIPKLLAGGGAGIMGGLGSLLSSSGTATPYGAAAGLAMAPIMGEIARKKQEKEDQALLNQQYAERRVEDSAILDNYDTNGVYMDLYAGGGDLPSTSPIKGKYATIGGKSKTIGNGVEEIEGNTHGESTIDGTSGVKLLDPATGEPQAEVEDKEVIVDGDYVFSDRLTVDGKTTFAKKMKSLTGKRNKIEKKLDNTTDTKSKNGYERMLSGLDMAETTLMAKQEKAKALEGEQILAGLAHGGFITDPEKGKGKIPTNPLRPAGTKLDFTQEEFAPVRKIETVIGPAGEKLYNYYLGKLPNEEGYNPDMDVVQHTENEHRMKQNKNTPEYSRRVVDYMTTTGNKLNRDIPLAKLAGGGTLPRRRRDVLGNNDEYTNNLANAKFYNPVDPEGRGPERDGLSNLSLDNEDPTDESSTFDYLAPNLIDNVGNALLTANSPRLAKPIMKRAMPMKTTINVAPQTGAVKNAVGAASDAILGNTSNSAVARANIASVRLAGAKQLGEIEANKENMETQLANADTQNRQGVSHTNADILANQNMLEFTRKNDIQSRISGNLADISKDIKGVQERKDYDKYYDESMLLSLLDDPTGDKARVMKRNPYFAKSRKLKTAINAENKRLNRP